MTALLHTAFAFPTLVWTVLLGVALIYWMFVVLGALDIDLFGDADVDGVLEGGADVGGADVGGADVGGADVGGDVGGDVADAGGDAGDAGDGAGEGGGAGILAALGLRKVPITVSLSLLFLFAWILSLVVLLAFADIIGALPGVIGSLVVLLGALFLAIPITALCTRPLAPLFVIHRGKGHADYIGSMCVVTTGRVDARFGQARIEDEGSVLLIPVRCDREGAFGRNDKALIIGYDEDRHAYLIEPMKDVIGTSSAKSSAQSSAQSSNDAPTSAT